MIRRVGQAGFDGPFWARLAGVTVWVALAVLACSYIQGGAQ